MGLTPSALMLCTVLAPVQASQAPTFQSVGLKFELLSHSTESFKFPLGVNDNAPVFELGIPPNLHQQLVDEVCLAVYRDKSLTPEVDLSKTANQLKAQVDSCLSKRSSTKISSAVLQWLLAEAVGAFCISRIDYAEEQAAPGFDSYERSRLNEPSLFLSKASPRAVCSGYTRVAAILSRNLGLTCYHIDGFTRSSSRDWTKPNHGWLLYDFGNGIRVPSDLTTRIHEFNSGRNLTNTDFSKLTTKYGWRILPKTVRDWELFSWVYYQYRLVQEEKQVPPNLSMLNLTFEQWKDLGSKPGLEKTGYERILNWYQKRDIALINSVRR